MPTKPRTQKPAQPLTHLDARGNARMVDIAAKQTSHREATAESLVLIGEATRAALESNTVKKGDVPATARLAGIMAAKRTHELIPLCHPLRLSSISIDIALIPRADLPRDLIPLHRQTTAGPLAGAVRITATVTADDRTGVEMEALTAASVAALTVYDMLKAVEKGIVIAATRLLAKSGGKSGDFRA
jgi:cyclic pyranopterin phosphate synthase